MCFQDSVFARRRVVSAMSASNVLSGSVVANIATEKLPVCRGIRTIANRRARPNRSTRWGSLVRADYPPPHEGPLARVFIARPRRHGKRIVDVSVLRREAREGRASPPLPASKVSYGAGTRPKRDKNSCADAVSRRYVLSVARHIASPVTVSEMIKLLSIPPRKCGPPESP